MRFLPLSLLSLFVWLTSCAGPDSSPDPADALFTRNAATMERVFDAYLAEDADRFWAEWADTAIFRGTGVNAPDTVTRAQAAAKFARLWGIYDYAIEDEYRFLPGVNPLTGEPDGSVRGYFHYEVIKPATDSTERTSARVWVYESFDFNEDGRIAFAQVYSDMASAYRLLEAR